MEYNRCRKIENFFKGFDANGAILRFNFKHQSAYRSFTGGFIYFFYLIFAIFYAIYTFYKFATRQDFNFTYNTDINSVASKINLTENKIAFAFGLVADNPTVPLYDYFDISLSSVNLTKDDTGKINKSKKPIKLFPCQPSNFFNLVDTSFNDLKLNNRKCAQDKDLVVEGIYSEKEFIYLEYSVSINPNYYLQTPMIRQIFAEMDVKAEIYFTDTSFTIHNFNDPVNHFINSYVNYLDFQTFKRLNLNILQTQFIKDAHVYFTEEKSTWIDTVEIAENYISNVGDSRLVSKPNNFNILSKMYIRSSSSQTTIKVVYSKLATYLADLSGMLSLFTLILMFFITQINDFKVEQAMIRKIFKFNNDMAYKNEDVLNHIKEKFKNIQQGKNKYI